MIFATLEEIKGLNDPPIETDEFDEVLSVYMEAIGQVFEEYCNRSFQADSYTDYCGASGNFVYLRATPVREITSVFADNDFEFLPEDEIESDDYRLIGDGKDGVVFGPFTAFQSKAVKVTYEGGYDPVDVEGDYPIPADLKLAFIRQVQHDFKRRRDVGLLTVTFKDGTIMKPNIHELLAQVTGVLDRYRWVNI